MHRFCIFFLLPSLLAGMASAQNVGIGTETPSEKLEVAGLVYTNQGGIKFPDNTVQTTAAYNTEPENATLPKGVGLMIINGIPGPIDTLGLANCFILYDFSLLTSRSINFQVGGGGGVPTIEFSPISVLKQIDMASTALFEAATKGDYIPEIEIYLTQDIPNPGPGNEELYLKYTLTNVLLTEFTNNLIFLRDVEFAHVERLSMIFEKIAIENLEMGGVFCWDVTMNQECN